MMGSKVRWLTLVALAWMVASPAAPAWRTKAEARPAAAPEAKLHGWLVAGPRAERAAGRVFLLGEDGAVLRVVTTRAAVVYSHAVPRNEQRVMPTVLVPGAEVTLTAMVDPSSGEWTASRVEILKLHAKPPARKPAKDADADDEDDDPALDGQTNHVKI
ncbi:MAG: hypothetical protein P4M01_13645 [Acidobacteriota bacterium]|nr:hypothetical protein [Acidobacteriota bacterium]